MFQGLYKLPDVTPLTQKLLQKDKKTIPIVTLDLPEVTKDKLDKKLNITKPSVDVEYVQISAPPPPPSKLEKVCGVALAACPSSLKSDTAPVQPLCLHSHPAVLVQSSIF